MLPGRGQATSFSGAHAGWQAFPWEMRETSGAHVTTEFPAFERQIRRGRNLRHSLVMLRAPIRMHAASNPRKVRKRITNVLP
mmetsp:Transcript_74006/g.169570  ORF Transcript_74006/g.169570 Transcript_74006/m.169570 type:complete len:82 (-) Transcript_74006:571-816(-)